VSKNLWETIKARTMLHNFPCTSEGLDYRLGEIHFCVSSDTPACEIEEICPLRPIYEEYRKLRAVVEAESLQMAPGEVVAVYRRLAAKEGNPQQAAKWRDLAKAWEGIA